MSLRLRLIAAFLILAGIGFYLLVDWVVDDLRPRYLEAMEESMVDTATILASSLSRESAARGISVDALRATMDEAGKRSLNAKIYELTKTRMDLRVYVTDDKGIVLFDSDRGMDEGDEGKDYSQWNDVARTLAGRYGARSTRSDRDDPRTSVLYVASPIRSGDRTIGVLTVGKNTENIYHFMDHAKRHLVFGGLLATLAVMILAIAVTLWITMPLRRLTRYAENVRGGSRDTLPPLGRDEIGRLGTAFEEMRVSLEGKQYAERYVQNLTHEMKSPISAIRGAAELLGEEMSAEQRDRFLRNIRNEANRLQDIVDRLLQLAAIENRRELRDAEEVDLSTIAAEAAESARPLAISRRIAIIIRPEGGAITWGERFLLRQAIANLLQNALEFSPENGVVDVAVTSDAEKVRLAVTDDGSGIPPYALERVFEKFYSLPRPATGMKGTGLGLPFVREVAHLHGGEVAVANVATGGVRATLALPRADRRKK